MSRLGRGNSKQQRRVFSAEFKEEAVRLMRERRAQGISLAQIGRELEIRPGMLRRWARRVEERAGASGGDVFGNSGQQFSVEEELRRVRRENAVLRQERDFLKKAAVFFAKESQ